MAGGTIRPVLTVMFIILLVAGSTIHRRALELVVHMAGLTGHVCVLALQFERGQIVVESGRRPAIHRVTLAAIQPEATLMRLIVMMTGVAILQGHLEVAKAARVDMTLYTGKTHVLTRQREGKAVVVKILPEPIHAIVTVETAGAKRQRMRGHEHRIHLTMACVASLRREGCDIAQVAVVALEGSPRSGLAVSIQREAHNLVRKGRAVHHRECRLRSPVLRVTVTASKTRIVVEQGPVHSGDVPHLPGNLHVTRGTALCHGRRAPGRDMTGFAVTTYLCMRCHTTQGTVTVCA